jgi:hypothetical protein
MSTLRMTRHKFKVLTAHFGMEAMISVVVIALAAGTEARTKGTAVRRARSGKNAILTTEPRLQDKQPFMKTRRGNPEIADDEKQQDKRRRELKSHQDGLPVPL